MIPANHIESQPNSTHDSSCHSPFLLDNETEYQRWRENKLAAVSLGNALTCISLSSDGLVNECDLEHVQDQIKAFNFFLFDTYAGNEAFDHQQFLLLGEQFGLSNLDVNIGAETSGITSLQAVDSSDRRARYIPYSNRALSWHTDGYYNPAQRAIRAFSLYCLAVADSGGENFVLDHEMLYLRIRDTDPELVGALMHENALEIPPNIVGNRVVRDTETGPVFSLDPLSGALSMRYSARPQNIVWRSDPLTRKALALIRELLLDSDDSVDFRLQAGQGVICNNILHGRRAYRDGDASAGKRTLWRARYWDSLRTTQ